MTVRVQLKVLKRLNFRASALGYHDLLSELAAIKGILQP